jgi:hypothetical protein
MDYLAKQSRIDYSTILSTSTLPVVIPFSFPQVHVQGKLISDKLKKSLYHHISSTEALSYWIQKGVLTTDNASLVYFDAINRASSVSKLSIRIFISKWASGHLGTGKVVRNKYRMDGSCPFCFHPDEDTAHIMDCQHTEATDIWSKHLKRFILTLHKAHFPILL